MAAPARTRLGYDGPTQKLPELAMSTTLQRVATALACVLALSGCKDRDEPTKPTLAAQAQAQR